MDNMCNKYLNWTFTDLETNNGGPEKSLRNYMMQYFLATFDY